MAQVITPLVPASWLDGNNKRESRRKHNVGLGPSFLLAGSFAEMSECDDRQKSRFAPDNLPKHSV